MDGARDVLGAREMWMGDEVPGRRGRGSRSSMAVVSRRRRRVGFEKWGGGVAGDGRSGGGV